MEQTKPANEVKRAPRYELEFHNVEPMTFRQAMRDLVIDLDLVPDIRSRNRVFAALRASDTLNITSHGVRFDVHYNPDTQRLRVLVYDVPVFASIDAIHQRITTALSHAKLILDTHGTR